MKKLNLLLLAGLFAFSLLSCKKSPKGSPMDLYAELDKSAPVNSLTAKEKDAGWQLLFDGKDTVGWHGYNLKYFPDCWLIEDGTFTMTTEGRGESQDIITDKVYKDFAFSIDFKLDTGANSGIIFQVAEDTMYKFPYETGPEFQVIDHENWPDSLADWQICGANYAMYPPIARPFKPVGEWNNIFLVVKGNHVTQMLNGVLVAEYEKYSEDWKQRRNSGKWADYPDYGKYDEGHISLQNHGTQVWYRNIKLKEIQP
jgi:hypothetical protein